MKCNVTAGCLTTTNLIKNGHGSSGQQLYICRKCNTKRAARYRATPHGKDVIYSNVYKSVKKYPQKNRARSYLNRLKAEGKIHPPVLCQVCGVEGVLHGHHKDYSKPYDVLWLCKSCHWRSHGTIYLAP